MFRYFSLKTLKLVEYYICCTNFNIHKAISNIVFMIPPSLKLIKIPLVLSIFVEKQVYLLVEKTRMNKFFFFLISYFLERKQHRQGWFLPFYYFYVFSKLLNFLLHFPCNKHFLSGSKFETLSAWWKTYSISNLILFA